MVVGNSCFTAIFVKVCSVQEHLRLSSSLVGNGKFSRTVPVVSLLPAKLSYQSKIALKIAGLRFSQSKSDVRHNGALGCSGKSLEVEFGDASKVATTSTILRPKQCFVSIIRR